MLRRKKPQPDRRGSYPSFGPRNGMPTSKDNTGCCPQYPLHCGSGRADHQDTLRQHQLGLLDAGTAAKPGLLRCTWCGAVYSGRTIHGKLVEGTETTWVKWAGQAH